MFPTTRTLRRSAAVLAAGCCLALLAPISATGIARPAVPASTSLQETQQEVQPGSGASPHRVEGTGEARDRTAVSRTGVDILAVEGDALTVLATPDQLAEVERLGFPTAPLAPRTEDVPSDPLAFPPNHQGYHDFAEVTSELRRTVSEHPDIARMSSIGASHEGRDLWLLSIGTPGPDVPEVLFTCSQHAREHLTTEMCLRIVERFTDGYGTDPDITRVVDGRVIHVVPVVNPDGKEYDIATGQFRSWRKNRQGQGTDLNRNWGHQWGCCGGSSGSPGSSTYRGAAAFSAPETARVRDFVASRVVGGEQRITAHIDWHTYSELVLWPYGYTYAETGPGLTARDARVFATLGRQLAATNGYTPMQASGLYITDGSIDDWMWAAHGIWSYTFEMYPRGAGGGGFYPPDSVIERETARNDEAVDLLLSYADCVPRVIGETCS
ncbi:M14 family metallopeptidase [Actinoalloteichus caeruleus]|uniref:M14 family metallopeptidase n=1 Tax=Actinoalloteichus cyanogriseus TaxID=2893586 RepID=UPI003AAB9912